MFDAASKDKPGAANRAFEILRATMFRAEERGLRERGSNPCLGIAKNPRNHFARFLDADELARLGRALDTGEAEWPEAVAAIRLLALTGCRRSEVLNLRWRDIGEDAINLADSKTGPRAVPLGEAARALIEALPGARETDAFQFPRHAEGRGEWSLTNCWRTVCADADLGRLRLHDLRHYLDCMTMSGNHATGTILVREYSFVGERVGPIIRASYAAGWYCSDAAIVRSALWPPSVYRRSPCSGFRPGALS